MAKKFPNRKRMFNLLTEEGREMAQMHLKFVEIFPDMPKRLEYIKALIEDLDKSLGQT